MADAGRKADQFPVNTTLTGSELLTLVDLSNPDTSLQNFSITVNNTLGNALSLVNGKIDLNNLTNNQTTYSPIKSITIDQKGRVINAIQGSLTGINTVNVGNGLMSTLSTDGSTLTLQLNQQPSYSSLLWPTNKGDILSADGAQFSIVPLSVNNGYVLTVDNTAATGFSWKAPTGGTGAVDSVTGTGPVIASPTTGNVVLSLDSNTFNLISPLVTSGTTQVGALIVNTSTNIATNTFESLPPPTSANKYLKYTGSGATGLTWDVPAGGGTVTSVSVPSGQGLAITGTGTDPIVGFNTSTPVAALNYIAPKLSSGTTQVGALIANKSTSLSTNDMVAVTPAASTGLVLTSVTADMTNPAGLAWTAIAPPGSGITGITQGAGVLIETTNPDMPTVSLNPATGFEVISPLVQKGDFIVSNSDTGLWGERFPLPTDETKTYKLQTSPTVRNTAFGMAWVEDSGGGGGGSLSVNGSLVNNPNLQNDTADSTGIVFTTNSSNVNAKIANNSTAAQALLLSIIQNTLSSNETLTSDFASLDTSTVSINTTYNKNTDTFIITIVNVPTATANSINGNIIAPIFFGGSAQLNATKTDWFFTVAGIVLSAGNLPSTNTVTITGNPYIDGITNFINYPSTTSSNNIFTNNTLNPYKRIFIYSSVNNLIPIYNGDSWISQQLNASNIPFNPANPAAWPSEVKTVGAAVSYLNATKFNINQIAFTTIGLTTFAVPAYVTKLYVTGTGAGGGGAWHGGGGGAGAYQYKFELDVTPGEVLTIRIGQGGLAGAILDNNPAADGREGDPSQIYIAGTTPTILFTLDGGKGGYSLWTNSGKSRLGGEPGNFWASKGSDGFDNANTVPGGTNPLGCTTQYIFNNDLVQSPNGFGSGGNGNANGNTGSPSKPSAGRPGLLIIEW